MPTLLLADDSLTIRRVIELTFADEDISVVTASDGREAIQKIKTMPPDIILADVGMPEHDGYEVAAFVKKSAHLAHIPVLLLAGAFEPVDHARARNVGCDGVLVKPFEPQLVIARVRELLAGRDASARPSTPHEPAATGGPAPDAPASTEPSSASGNYLDRLDAAFASMSTTPRPFGVPVTSAAAGASEEADDAWKSQIVTNSGQPVHGTGGAAATAGNPGSVYQGSAAAGASTTPSLSDAFGALLAAERGTPFSGPPLPPIALSDATLDEIARRVIARLGDEPMRQAVLDAAERLVREEIERIKKVQQRPSGSA